MAIDGPLVVHEMSFAVDAIVAGIGIGLVPEIYLGWTKGGARAGGARCWCGCCPSTASSAPRWPGIPPTAYEPARVKLLRDFLADRLAGMMRACTAVAAEEKAARRAGRRKGRATRRASAGNASAARAVRAPPRMTGRSGLGDDLQRPADDAVEHLQPCAPRGSSPCRRATRRT